MTVHKSFKTDGSMLTQIVFFLVFVELPLYNCLVTKMKIKKNILKFDQAGILKNEYLRQGNNKYLNKIVSKTCLTILWCCVIYLENYFEHHGAIFNVNKNLYSIWTWIMSFLFKKTRLQSMLFKSSMFGWWDGNKKGITIV